MVLKLNRKNALQRYNVINLFYAQNQKLNKCSCLLGLRPALIAFQYWLFIHLVCLSDVEKKKTN